MPQDQTKLSGVDDIHFVAKASKGSCHPYRVCPRLETGTHRRRGLEMALQCPSEVGYLLLFYLLVLVIEGWRQNLYGLRFYRAIVKYKALWPFACRTCSVCSYLPLTALFGLPAGSIYCYKRSYSVAQDYHWGHIQRFHGSWRATSWRNYIFACRW